MRMVYICHPLAKPSVEENIKITRKIVQDIINTEGPSVLPLSPHLYFPQILDDGKSKDRNFGMEYAMYFLRRSDEVWVYGDVISEGMKKELEEASGLKIPIRFFEVPQ